VRDVKYNDLVCVTLRWREMDSNFRSLDGSV